eukprot:c17913_g1_i5 orf=552-854(-)
MTNLHGVLCSGLGELALHQKKLRNFMERMKYEKFRQSILARSGKPTKNAYTGNRTREGKELKQLHLKLTQANLALRDTCQKIHAEKEKKWIEAVTVTDTG